MGPLKRMIRDDGFVFLLGDFPAFRLPECYWPVSNAIDGTKEDNYNRAHKKTRIVIERSFWVLKSRFRYLLRHRVLHYDPVKAGKIVYACMILHNICMTQSIPLGDIDEADQENYEDDQELDVLQNDRACRLHGKSTSIGTTYNP